MTFQFSREHAEHTSTVLFYAPTNKKYIQKTARAFGIAFPNWSLAETAERLVNDASIGARKRVAFVNAHCINEMNNSHTYDQAVRSADIILPDGSGMAIASLLASDKKCNNLNGTDLAPYLAKAARDKGISIFLLGARPGVAKKAGVELTKQYPGLKIAGTHHGYFDISEEASVITAINETKPDIVLVAFGVPKQDVWLAQNAHRLSASITIGVGGLFDFLSNRIPRAPMLLRKTGLEWTYRLYQEPRRMWRRYILGNPTFIIRALLSAIMARTRLSPTIAGNAQNHRQKPSIPPSATHSLVFKN